MAINVTVRILEPQYAEFMYGPGGGVHDYFTDVGREMEFRAKRFCPVDDGLLRASITLGVSAVPPFLRVSVGTDVFYAMWVHDGTGIYNGRDYLRPVRAPFMVFVPKGSSQKVFAKKVRGQPGKPFLLKAFLETAVGQ